MSSSTFRPLKPIMVDAEGSTFAKTKQKVSLFPIKFTQPYFQVHFLEIEFAPLDSAKDFFHTPSDMMNHIRVNVAKLVTLKYPEFLKYNYDPKSADVEKALQAGLEIAQEMFPENGGIHLLSYQYEIRKGGESYGKEKRFFARNKVTCKCCIRKKRI